MFSCPLEDTALPHPGLGVYLLLSPSPGLWVTTATTRATTPGRRLRRRTLPTDQDPENQPQCSGANLPGRTEARPQLGKMPGQGAAVPGPIPPRWATSPLVGGGQPGRGSHLMALQVILTLSKVALVPGRGRKMSEYFDSVSLARCLLAF